MEAQGSERVTPVAGFDTSCYASSPFERSDACFKVAIDISSAGEFSFSILISTEDGDKTSAVFPVVVESNN